MNILLLSQWLLAVALSEYTTDVNGQFIAPPVTCSGNIFTYQCIVNGGGINGITIWRVDGSSECTLVHASAGNTARCGPENAFTATTRSGFGTSATSYSSTLSGIVTTTLNGTLVECFGPATSRDADNMVGSSTLQILGPLSVPTLLCIDLSEDTDGTVNVTVNWTRSDGDSADFYLINITTNGPQSPYGGLLNITNASVTQCELTGFQAGYEYNITVHGVTGNCGGLDSKLLRITPQVPATPMTDVCAVYNTENETLQIIEISWNEVDNVTVSENCTNGQVQANYELSYNTESGTPITTCDVHGTQCSNGMMLCRHVLQSYTEDSMCQPPVSQFSGDGVTVSLTARNIVGRSNPAVSRIISGRNVDLRVSIDATNFSSVIVECTLSQSGYNCTIEYGTNPSYTNLDYRDTSLTLGQMATINLSQRIRRDTTYYYIVTAAGSSQCVRVQGRFQARCNETDLTNQGGTVNTATCAARGFVNSLSISDGVVCYNTTTAGSKAVYICDDDFLLMEGDEVTRVCQKDGIWNDSIPQCIPKLDRIVGVVGGVLFGGVLLIGFLICMYWTKKKCSKFSLLKGFRRSGKSGGDSTDAQDILAQQIIDAIERGETSAIEQWLQENPTKVNECRGGSANYRHFAVANGTALHWAVYYGRLEVVQLLLTNGADPYQRAEGGETILHWACQSKEQNDAILQRLIVIRNNKVETGEPLVNVADDGGLTPLHFACSSNNNKLVQLLLKEGADPHARDHFNATPRHRLSGEDQNYREIAALLDKCHLRLSRCGPILQEHTPELSPLHTAARQGNLDQVKDLVDKVSDINSEVSHSGRTPLHMAAERGHKKIVEYLFDKGANVIVKDKKGLTPLLVAAEGGHMDIVEYLVKRGAHVDTKDDERRTPLHMAAKGGHMQLVKYLVDGEQANIRKDDRGRTPVYMAAAEGHLSIVKYFVGVKQVDIGSQDNINRTLLHVAARGGHKNIVEYLVDQKAEINVTDKYQGTPLHMAAKHGDLQIVKYLIEKGANISTQNNDGRTPLHIAARRVHVETAEYLVDKGADINLKDSDGWTPVYMAAASGSIELLKYLVDVKQADISIKDNTCMTPLHVAARGGHIATVTYLVKNKANINITDVNGRTPLDMAVEKGHMGIVEYLKAKDIELERNLYAMVIRKKRNFY